MQVFKDKLVALISIVLGAVLVMGYVYQKTTILETQLKVIEDKEKQDQVLGQYVLNMMAKTSASKKLSDARKIVLARAIVRISNEVFDNNEYKRTFVTVLAIESGFDRFAQSPTGPKGLAQVAKNTFFEALKECGINDVSESDSVDVDLNLTSGACYLKKLLDQNNGDPYAAIVAYNQGPNSDSAKTYAKNGSLSEIEPLKYVARFAYLQKKVSEEDNEDSTKLLKTTKSIKMDSQDKENEGSK